MSHDLESLEWSTESASPDERFDYWCDVICEAVLNVRASRADEGAFDARINANRLPGGNFVRFRSRPHEVIRGRRLLSTAPDERYLVSLQMSGRCHIEQGEARFTLEPGDLGVVSSARPLHQRFEGPVGRTIAILPRGPLEATCSWLSPGVALRIPRHRSTARAVAGLAFELSSPHPQYEAREADAMTEAFLRLLGACRDGANERRQTARNRERLIAYMRSNLTDPALSPSVAATALAMSERTIHSLLAHSGTSFGRWVMNERLTGAAGCLADPAWSGHTITEIAFRWGFSDASHFAHRFREKFGVPPRAYRSSK